MSSPVIIAENLGKKYRLDHRLERPRYTALRDVIAEKAKQLLSRSSGGKSVSDRASFSRTEDFWALDDVSFEVKQGEAVGIIGRNGAGKSTLLKILSRITDPTTGRIVIRGRIASLLEVGTGFHPELTGRENIYLNGAILGMSRADIRRRFDEIVAFAEVEKFLDTPVKRYSSGMYVRLAFGVAAHLEPDILVIDEVLAVGDAEFQRKCLGKMESAAKGGRTVLFVSHNMSAVQSLCGTGILMDQGRLKKMAPVEETVADYLTGLRAHGALGLGSPVDLGPSLHVSNLTFRPPVIESGRPISLHVQLKPRAPVVIKEMAVLIHSDLGVRVAILDLRRTGMLECELWEDALDLEIFVGALTLVEGNYRLGFYVSTEGYNVDRPDVASFTVCASRDKKNTVSYAPQYRGFVELDFSLRQVPVFAREVAQ